MGVVCTYSGQPYVSILWFCQQDKFVLFRLIWTDLNRTEYGTEWRGMNLELTLIIPPIICLINCLIKLHLIAAIQRSDRVRMDIHVYATHLYHLPFQLQIRSSFLRFRWFRKKVEMNETRTRDEWAIFKKGRLREWSNQIGIFLGWGPNEGRSQLGKGNMWLKSR